MQTMIRRSLLALAVLSFAACAPRAPAPQEETQTTSFVVATPEQGAAVFSAEDEFMGVVTPADISIRTRSADGTHADLVSTYAAAFVPWTDEERARLDVMLARHADRLQSIAQWLPDSVLILKSNGAADTALPHTRGNAINMGQSLPESDDGLDGLFFHELFHVLSRNNAARHNEMYALINFVPCAIDLPDDLAARTITNPDAPLMRHAASLDDQGHYVFTALFAEPARFDPARPQFGAYMHMRFLQGSRDANGQCTLSLNNGQPVNVAPEQAAEAFYRAAGRNTEYILHPEELLADNFAQLMMGATVPNPEVHQRLATFLGITAPQAAQPAPATP